MNAGERANSEKAIQQAHLILKLYELRREPVMREARSYVGGEFLPGSADELVDIVTCGGKKGSLFCRSTVTGTWCRRSFTTERSMRSWSTTPAPRCTSSMRRFSPI